jgi:hypothetical protein
LEQIYRSIFQNKKQKEGVPPRSAGFVIQSSSNRQFLTSTAGEAILAKGENRTDETWQGCRVLLFID